LLGALHDPAADVDKDGLVNTNALAHYVSGRVAALTGGQQRPAMEVRLRHYRVRRRTIGPDNRPWSSPH